MKNKFLSGISIPALFFSCQIASLGLLRQTPSYSFWEAEIVTYPTLALWLARILSVIVLLAATIAISRGLSFLKHRRLLLVNGTALIIGSALTFYAASSLPLYLISQICIGISHAWILICWAEYLSTLKAALRTRCIALSALIAVVLFALAGMMPTVVQGVLFLLIVLGSALPLAWLQHETTARETNGNDSRDVDSSCVDSRGEDSRGIDNVAAHDASAPIACSSPQPLKRALELLPVELVVLMASYAMLFRILVFFDFPVQDNTLFLAIASVLRIGGMALILLYLAWTHFRPSMRQIILPLLFLTALGVALLPAQNTLMSSFSVAIIHSSWTFFYTMMWLVLFELGRVRGRFSLLIFMSGWTLMNTFLLVAAPLASLLKNQVSEGTLSLTALACVIIYTLSVGMLLLRKRKPVTANDGSIFAGGASYKDVVGSDQGDATSWKEEQEAFHRAVALQHHLTNREAEVFELLVQGYSLPAIEEKFVLSHSTIKGHARSIYRKFNVGSKQELIEKVNELRAQPTQ